MISALMNNFDIAREATQTAMESDGSAMSEYSKYLDSLEAKTKQFKAAFQDLSQTILDSDFLKGLVDSGTAALNVIQNLTEALGPAGLLASITAIVAVVKNFGNSNEFAHYGCESIAA